MFKNDFKYYKSKQHPVDLQNVLNFNEITDSVLLGIKRVEIATTKFILFGLTPPEEWNVYEITTNPGFIFIQNPFTTVGQRYWIVRSLLDYSRTPNKTNLDAHAVIPETESWWEFCKMDANRKLLNKLRWATLGYHHNWDTKEYSEHLRNEFPVDLGTLGKYIADVIGFDDFKAEAAIVNYYHLDSTLSGHTDHSEHNLEAPLISFSFGQSAIFLLGGKTIDVKPTAVFLHSGDVVVMSKESRLAYHGVPKILKCHDEPWRGKLQYDVTIGQGFDSEAIKICCEDEGWKPFQDYLDSSRININVRQVLRHN